MNDLQTRQAIVQSLAAFAAKPLAEAAIGLFETLGYNSTRRFRLQPNTARNFVSHFAHNRPFNSEAALTSDWISADFLFQITDEEIRGASSAGQPVLFESKGAYQGAQVESYIFLAIALKARGYTRGELSSITRAVNALFDMPALILFQHGNTLTLAVIDRRLHKRDATKDVLEKVTLIKDIRFENTHRAHLEILADLALLKLWENFQFTNFVSLHHAWRQALSSSELNRRFYYELANWYFWALQHVRFPDDAQKDRDGQDSISLIRLITRLIFCWFLREKGLIPDALFQKTTLEPLLKFSRPEDTIYYKAVLQNLFFATLNTEMDVPGQPASRVFSTQSYQHHMIHSAYRYEKLVKKPADFLKLFQTVPFLNGGLFECLDEREGAREIRIDGFSDNPKNTLQVPDFLFFGDEQTIDLSGVYGELRYTRARVRPLIPLLEKYKFTVAENTPIEEEVALDPELLGHVFENLLASYNPETDQTARKTTGSFYTPRVVVDFMVDESLVSHLASQLSAPAQSESSGPVEDRLRQLLSYTSAPPQFTDPERLRLIDAIDQTKILDPACGSGAFPMGALHKLVFLLGKLDPGNAAWKERQLAKARELDVARDAAEQAVEDAFSRDHGDYARKLYLIENCLYGVDIQPIAVQIAKLRCFISLVVEQEPNDRLPNRGILPLPNLETKFIAANTLLGLHRLGQMELVMRDVEDKKAELRRVRHEHFLARRYNQKKALRKRDRELRSELATLLKSSHLFSAHEAEMVARWDLYHADSNADFFDLEWMFGLDPSRRQSGVATLRGNLALVNEIAGQTEIIPSQATSVGFDIVIGNPPYVRQEEIKDLKPKLKDDYFCYTGIADLFVYFYEKSFDLLRVGGVLCFISSNKYLRVSYGERLRHFLATNGAIHLVIDFGDASVFTAVAYPSIILAQKIRETREKTALSPVKKDLNKFNAIVPMKAKTRVLKWESGPDIEEFPQILAERGFEIPQRELKPDGWRLESPTKLRLMERLRSAGTPLRDYTGDRVYRGITTGLNEAFVVDGPTRDRLVAEHKASAELLKPFARGRDVERWITKPSEEWLIFTRRGCEIQKYPAIHEYLKQFKKQLTPGGPGGRKPGRYEWFEIQDNIAYWQQFERKKIVSTKVSIRPTFALETSGCYLGNTSYFFPVTSEALYLLGVLNSHVFETYARRIFVDKQNGWYEVQPEGLEAFPVPTPPPAARAALERAVDRVLKAKKANRDAFVGEFESEIDGLVAHIFGLTEEEYRAILDEVSLLEPVRVGALNAYRETKRTLAK